LAAYEIKDNGKTIAIFLSLEDAEKRHKEVLRNAVNCSLYEQHCLTTYDPPKPFAEFLEEQAVRDRDLEATIERLQTTPKIEDPEDAVLPTDSDVKLPRLHFSQHSL